ncbi:hypothetical protein M885DRAFT_64012 [Pelagophyceae sp. CCMP2097]|nr:hypothetical protein M885DRAFT_64012 [Pelagophyceae sp. CCMP2097]
MSTQMNSAEVENGSMWKQEGEAPADVARYLVKWVGLSHLHLSWEHEKDLFEQLGPIAKDAALAAYEQNPASGSIDPEKLTVDRIIAIDAHENGLLGGLAGLLPVPPALADDAFVTVQWCSGGAPTRETAKDLRGAVAFEAALKAFYAAQLAAAAWRSGATQALPTVAAPAPVEAPLPPGDVLAPASDLLAPDMLAPDMLPPADAAAPVPAVSELEPL